MSRRSRPPVRLVPVTIAMSMTKTDLLRDFAAAAERDLAPLLRRACDDLYFDDADRLKAIGVLLAKAWADGAAAGSRGGVVAEAVNSDLEIDDGALAAALADKVRPAVSVKDVLRGIAARSAATGGATGGSATRDEIASQLSVSPDEVSRTGGDPDGPLGRAIKLGYVEPNPTYKGYWRLSLAGQAQLGT